MRHSIESEGQATIPFRTRPRRWLSHWLLADVTPCDRPASLAQCLLRFARPSEIECVIDGLTDPNRRGT